MEITVFVEVLIVCSLTISILITVYGLYGLLDDIKEIKWFGLMLLLSLLVVIALNRAVEEHSKIEGLNAYVDGRVITDTLHTGEVLYTFIDK